MKITDYGLWYHSNFESRKQVWVKQPIKNIHFQVCYNGRAFGSWITMTTQSRLILYPPVKLRLSSSGFNKTVPWYKSDTDFYFRPEDILDESDFEVIENEDN